jgi:hypothetical protein
VSPNSGLRNLICTAQGKQNYQQSNYVSCVRFQVLTAVSMKMIAFWGIAPYSLIEVD